MQYHCIRVHDQSYSNIPFQELRSIATVYVPIFDIIIPVTATWVTVGLLIIRVVVSKR